MIFRSTNISAINILAISLLAVFLSACSSSSSSDGATSATSVSMSAAPSPANSAGVTAGSGSKTFVTADGQGNTVTLTKAYLVISSTTIETTCGASFSAALDGLLDAILPQAHAHTTTTPTSTGVPYVINLLATDNVVESIGSMSPAVADYCGVDIDLFAADADAINLPAGPGEPDMIGKTVYIEGSYTLSAGAGGGGGRILIDTGAALQNRNLLLSALMMISASTPTGSVSLGINYDLWFDAIDLSILQTETLTSTDHTDPEVSKVLQNITGSIHQL